MSESIPNREMVVFALHALGGATNRYHTEDIALTCFKLWPSAFSWTKYVQYPDKDIVRVALTDARKEKYGTLVEGRTGQTRGHSSKTKRRPSTDGWTLTDAGVRWVKKNKNRFASVGTVTKDHRQKSLQFLRKVKGHKVFAMYSDNPGRFYPLIGDLADMLNCRVDADDMVWRGRFERIRKHAVAAGQDEYIGFVEKSIEAYRKQQ